MAKKLPWANKDLGQHFLNDQKVIKEITDDFKDQAKNIIEIGPGPGILTELLASHQLPFHVIEKDTRMIEYLGEILPEQNIYFGDALEVDYSEFIKERGIADELWLVSNLPYNVSTPLLLKFLQTPEIKYMTLMFQKEVADKVYPFATKKNFMGSLMALSLTYFEADLLCKVPPGAFIPPPKVDSAVITFKRRKNPVVALCDFNKFEKFLRATFQFKRKQIGKNLASYIGREQLNKILEEMGLPTTIRAEALQLEDLQKLYNLCQEVK
jgi:16S rRNA (adenine1518-N6/adenine1519-N6)-dimethyltransferase